MKTKISKIFLWTILVVLVLVGLYWLPPIHSRLSWRLENIVTRVKFAINPPDESIFIPILNTTTPTTGDGNPQIPSTPTLTKTITPQDQPTLLPAITATPLPDYVSLPNVVYVDQFNRWNYCGPASLTMALNYWGWPGNRDDIAAVVKPGIQDMNLDFIQQGKSDKNVMPYELTDYVQDFTNFNVVLRYGGDIEILKQMVAAGFPVVTEKGYYEEDYTGKIGWMGHYQFVTGYDQTTQTFIVQDTYNDGPNFQITYDEFIEGWRSFDYIFFIVYPPERDFEIFRILDQWADPNWSYQHALEVAEKEILVLSGIDQYFAWFNKGTSLVKLGRYSEAAIAFDQAFILYADLSTDNRQRPYRMMWYQTSPYMAYYYSGRYGDVINLANVTLDTIVPSTLEESFYWRGMAKIALGQNSDGIDDLLESVRLNLNFTAGRIALSNLGVKP